MLDWRWRCLPGTISGPCFLKMPLVLWKDSESDGELENSL